MRFETMRGARTLLAAHLPVTRLVDARSLPARTGTSVYLKLECELPTGSFKVRGALWALARRLEAGPVAEVVASSTGNHGAAVAWAARRLGVPATIFLPAEPNPVKRARIAEAGARIIEDGADLAAAWARAEEYAAADGRYFLNDATDAELPAGTATIALEALEQAPDIRTFVVPVGDTALIRGVAAAARAVRPDMRIIGVQAAGAPAYTRSWQTGAVVTTPTAETLADGLATRKPVAANVEDIRRLVDAMVVVTDDEMLAAVAHLESAEDIVAEPAGAAATAALLAHDVAAGPTCAIVTGRNITDDLLARARATAHG
jgi:threonine dehydratase